MNKANVERELKKNRRIRHLGLIVPIIGFCLFIAVGGGVFGFLVFAAAIIGGMLIRANCYYQSKNVILRDIAEVVIEQYVHDLVYDPLALLIYSTIKGLYLALPRYSDMRASDHIRGTYNERSIEIADIHLARSSNDYSETVFVGPFLKVETSKKISSPLTITTDKSLIVENIKTENITFNEKFAIYCKDEDEAFRILTPQMMEKISYFESDKQGYVHFCFATDGHLYCAINEGRDRFELKKNKKTVEEISEGFDGDIRYVLSLIDELIDMLEEEE